MIIILKIGAGRRQETSNSTKPISPATEHSANEDRCGERGF